MTCFCILKCFLLLDQLCCWSSPLKFSFQTAPEFFGSFYDFYLFVQLPVLLRCCFPDFIELYVFFYNSLNSLKIIISNCQAVYRSLIWGGKLLNNYCILSVVSHFLDFSCSLKSPAAVFTAEEAVTSSSCFCFCFWQALGEKDFHQSDCLGVPVVFQDFSMDEPSPLLLLLLGGGSLRIVSVFSVPQN